MDTKTVSKPGEVNQALFNITHGLYILTGKSGERINGQCLDALMQVTNVPPRLAIAVAKKNLTHDMIKESGVFAVNVLDRNDPDVMETVKHFGFQSGRDVDKFEMWKYFDGSNGCPILENSKAYYECCVITELTADLGTHRLFIADVNRASVRGTCEPLTYNEYRKIKTKGR